MLRIILLTASVLCLSVASQLRAQEITHSFLACGQETYMVDETGKRLWSYPHKTRDGYVLNNGNILLTLSPSKKHKGGAVVEIKPDGIETVIWKGTQSEVNSVEPTNSDTYVITEAGSKPRLLEIDRTGKVVIEFPLQCQLERVHLQTRMARKLADGSYLAPHLLDFAVKHYAADGKLLGQIETTVPGDQERKIESWPFTAIRHGDGQTLVTCTRGNRVVDYDAEGKIAWQLTNEDLPGPWLQDPCGCQLLPNGNIVVTSYAAGKKDVAAPKLFEVTPEKEIVWKFIDEKKQGVHHFQIITTNGEKLTAPAMK